MQQWFWTPGLSRPWLSPLKSRFDQLSRYRWLPLHRGDARGQPRAAPARQQHQCRHKDITNSNCPISRPALKPTSPRTSAIPVAEANPNPCTRPKPKLHTSTFSGQARRREDFRTRPRQSYPQSTASMCPMPSLRSLNQLVATVRSMSTLADLDCSPNMTCRSPLPGECYSSGDQKTVTRKRGTNLQWRRAAAARVAGSG
jgi:hypothetical protein